MLGVFFGLQSVTYALANNAPALIAFIVAALVVTLTMGRMAFLMTVRKAQVERVAKAYGVTMERAAEILAILEKDSGATI
jgi:phosphatidylserine synthase